MKTAFYDLAVSPVTFDFAGFALMAKAVGCERLVIVPGERPGRLKHYEDSEAKQRVFSIMLPLVRALGMGAFWAGTREEAAWVETNNRENFPPDYRVDGPKPFHRFRHIVKNAPLGVRWKVDPWILDRYRRKYEGAVVITLRDQEFQPERNSNNEAWYRAAGALQKHGFKTAFIGDFSRQVVLMEERLAAMQLALVNMGVANGPMALASYTDWPCIMMKLVTELPNSNERFWGKLGIPVGTQPHWFGPHQRFVWEDDSERHIIAAFDAWCEMNPKRVESGRELVISK